MNQSTRFTINHLEICLVSRTIRSGEQSICIEPKAMKLLRVLAEKNGETITIDELRDVVWNGVYVCRHAIYRTISRVRKAFADLDGERDYIETIARSGYRMNGDIDFGTQIADDFAKRNISKSSWGYYSHIGYNAKNLIHSWRN